MREESAHLCVFLVVATRTIGRRTEKKAEAGNAEAGNGGDADANMEQDSEISSDEDGDDNAAETGAGDPHLMTRKELRKTFKEHTVDAQAGSCVVVVVALIIVVVVVLLRRRSRAQQNPATRRCSSSTLLASRATRPSWTKRVRSRL